MGLLHPSFIEDIYDGAMPIEFSDHVWYIRWALCILKEHPLMHLLNPISQEDQALHQHEKARLEYNKLEASTRPNTAGNEESKEEEATTASESKEKFEGESKEETAAITATNTPAITTAIPMAMGVSMGMVDGDADADVWCGPSKACQCCE